MVNRNTAECTLGGGTNAPGGNVNIFSTRAYSCAVAESIPNVLCMSGNRKGMADDEGMENCATGLKRVMKFAEDKKITVLAKLFGGQGTMNVPSWSPDGKQFAFVSYQLVPKEGAGK